MEPLVEDEDDNQDVYEDDAVIEQKENDEDAKKKNLSVQVDNGEYIRMDTDEMEQLEMQILIDNGKSINNIQLFRGVQC